jgi:hypothetical protein
LVATTHDPVGITCSIEQKLTHESSSNSGRSRNRAALPPLVTTPQAPSLSGSGTKQESTSSIYVHRLNSAPLCTENQSTHSKLQVFQMSPMHSPRSTVPTYLGPVVRVAVLSIGQTRLTPSGSCINPRLLLYCASVGLLTLIQGSSISF